MQIQFEIKNWEFTFFLGSDFGMMGHLALPLELDWWLGDDVRGSKHWDIGFTFLIFRFHIEIWKWKK